MERRKDVGNDGSHSYLSAVLLVTASTKDEADVMDEAVTNISFRSYSPITARISSGSISPPMSPMRTPSETMDVLPPMQPV